MPETSRGPKNPFRSTVILYAVMSTLIVVVGSLTGTPLLPKQDRESFEDFGTLPVAVGFFLIATSYSWLRLRRRSEPDEKGSS
jgi:hypothetical protein